VVTRILRGRRVRDAIYLVSGLAITAWSLNAFLVPNKLAAGGASGLATVLYHVGQEAGITVPIGMQMLAMNALLMVWVYRAGGLRYAAKTVAGIVGLSVLVDVSAPFVSNLAPHDLLLAALYGGAISGVGLGLVFKAGANTGGTDILGQLLAKRSNLGVGQLVLIFDAVIVALAGIAFGPELALYAVVAIAVMGWVIDLVLEGISLEKAVWIVSDEADRIGAAVIEELGRGATRLEATGVYTGNRRGMLWVVLSRREIDSLKALVASIDPTALVIISNIHEAIGEGFKEMGV